MNDNFGYEYKNVPITPKIIEDIIIKLFNGQTVKRDKIITDVLNFHKENGGREPRAQNFDGSVKTTLWKMKKKDIARNISPGQWEILKEDKEIIKEGFQKVKNENNVDIKLNNYPKYGNGNEIVYLYYLKSNKELAELKKEKIWPCKIGRTRTDLLSRILSQASTALPEIPFIAFEINTDDALTLENFIHSALKLRNREKKDAPGKEWFYTNPEEVIEIHKSINMNCPILM